MWPAALGLAFFLAGIWTYRSDLLDRRSRTDSVAAIFIAAPLATFAGEHFTAAKDIARLVPKWLPLRLPIAYFVGVALLAAALSFVARRWVRWSAPLLGLMFALFVLLMDLPAAIAHAGNRIGWIFPLRESEFAIGAFCLGPRVSMRFAPLARRWTACVLILFGIQNVLDPQFSPGVPDTRPTSAWVPAPRVVAYIVGALLIAFGVAALFEKAANAGIASAGILMTVLTIALFAPDLFLARGPRDQVSAINFVADTLLFAGTMFAVAGRIAVASEE